MSIVLGLVSWISFFQLIGIGHVYYFILPKIILNVTSLTYPFKIRVCTKERLTVYYDSQTSLVYILEKSTIMTEIPLLRFITITNFKHFASNWSILKQINSKRLLLKY
jgi:hypothetical protein